MPTTVLQHVPNHCRLACAGRGNCTTPRISAQLLCVIEHLSIVAFLYTLVISGASPIEPSRSFAGLGGS